MFWYIISICKISWWTTLPKYEATRLPNTLFELFSGTGVSGMSVIFFTYFSVITDYCSINVCEQTSLFFCFLLFDLCFQIDELLILCLVHNIYLSTKEFIYIELLSDNKWFLFANDDFTCWQCCTICINIEVCLWLTDTS